MMQDRLTVPPATGNHSTSSSPLSSEIPMDPAAVAEVALAVQLERLRVTEALAARDNVVVRLEDAYTSVRQKSAIVSRLERELEILRRSSTPSSVTPSALQEIQHCDSSNGAEDQTDDEKGVNLERHVRSDSPSSWVRIITPPKTACFLERPTTCASRASDKFVPSIALSSLSLEGGAEKTIAARHSILAALPLPPDIAEEELQPIFLPHSYSLGDFFRNTTGTLKNLLKNYRVLAQVTTYWCPDREEHGYFLAPVFKCITNPRVVTAHRWLAVDVLGHMREPTECFYHKNGKWYYAGTYRAFRMDDLTTQEWDLLSTETTQALIKETLAGRKNVSPQNTYETGQLYAVGALRISCVGLQCIGFNKGVYHAVLEQSRFVHWTRGSGWTAPTPLADRHGASSDDGKSSVD
ncbi:hypothetical protein EDD16DRAFT_592804 [Pisolithus croceorrhizus]|nr:hypothetical protein EDD16DRAFT_592804 [Pisolithus croceorrhizus]KAI6150212.1 hypothetical protein EDD17DRAFT_1155502 [Pisolithus thermaeus]